MATAHDTAAYILAKTGPITTMKLQKLLYYCQGWSLAWDSKPLYREEIQAWANGPVIYEVFKRHRGQFTIDTWPAGNPHHLTGDEKETIDAVIEGYGSLSGRELSEKTHDERPWKEARRGLEPGAASNRRLDLDTMQDYFSGLAAFA